MSITFFDNDGIIHKEFVPACQTAFYEEVLKQLLQRMRCVRPGLHRIGRWMLLHDKALVHRAIHVHQFSAQRGVPVLHHPPYCPDLAPVNFFLFHCLKSVMKGACFVT